MTPNPRMPRALMIIMGSSFLLNLSFYLYRSVFTNFTVELGITASQFGWLEGIREIPGLLTVVMVAFAARLSDERLYAVSASLIALGIGMYAFADTYTDLIAATLVQSIGFHMWSVVQDSMVMKSAGVGDRARRLGQVNSVAAAATLLGVGFVFAAAAWLGLRPFFLIACGVGLGGALVALLVKPDPSAGKKATYVFRWQYRSYYILTLLSGARRHIVSTFAAFALVKLYGASVQTMTILLAFHSFLAIWTRPMIGRLIDRIGEQRALSINYIVVAMVFVGYAIIREPWVIFGLFVLDNVLSGFDIAISTHAGRIIPREELSASLATGVSINHIFGVAVPVMGGLLWEWFNPAVPFLMGAGLVLIGMFYSWNLDKRVTPQAAA